MYSKALKFAQLIALLSEIAVSVVAQSSSCSSPDVAPSASLIQRQSILNNKPKRTSRSARDKTLHSSSHRVSDSSKQEKKVIQDTFPKLVSEKAQEVEAGERDEALEAATTALLTSELVDLGVSLFGSREHLESVVEKSVLVPMSFANVQMELRIAHGDDANGRLPEENGDGYGLDTLMGFQDSEGMINVVDMGGNYGAVTIAAYKKYPDLVRSVVAEPIPATFFFLRWNMALNNVTVVDESEFTAHPRRPGVVLLHKAVSAKGDETLRVCEMPWSTMNAHLSWDKNTCKCDKEEMHCAEVPSVAAEHMVDLFGGEDIGLWKLDCEGCEHEALPAIAKGPHAARVKRMAGELHDPDPDVVQLACKWDSGKFLTAFCRGGVNRVDGSDICSRCTFWE